MSDEGFVPFPFQSNGPTSPEVEAPKKRGGRRAKKNKGGRPRKTQSELSPADQGKTAADVVKKTRKARKPRALKLDLTTAMQALSGLKEDDVKFLSEVVQAMQPFNKAARTRIVAALGKVFA